MVSGPSMPERPTARAPVRYQGGNKLLIHGAGDHFRHRIDHGLVTDAQTIHEARRDAALFKKARHLLAAAMDHNQRSGRRESFGKLRCQRIPARRISQAACRPV